MAKTNHLSTIKETAERNKLKGECMYGVSRRYDGSRPQSVFVLACVRLWLCRPIRDAQSRPQT